MFDLNVLQPETIAETLELLTNFGEDAVIVSGGTATVLMLKAGFIEPEAMISIGRLQGLDYVRREDDVVKFGALTPLRCGETSAEVQELLPALGKTMAQVGNVRIRNAATIGGNLAEADYASDPPTTLVAMGASVVAVSQRGERIIPLSEFFTDFYSHALEPDELITEVRVPVMAESARASYLKFVTRSSEDRPCIGTAAVVDVDEDGTCRSLRVVVGAVAATPQTFPEAEQLAVGQVLDERLMTEIGDAYTDLIDPIDDLRGSKWYRRKVISVFVRRAIESAVAGG